MLKIYIGDTEVVSSNEISIKEEFLNPSSVILNNAMPKSWEDERNYTGFYHFKDYDKCKILDLIDHEEIEGTTVEGTSLSVDYNNEYDFEYKLLGQTEQDGTPTPDNPIPVNVVTGYNQIVIKNKNLYDVGTLSDYIIGGALNDLTIDGNTLSATIKSGASAFCINNEKHYINEAYFMVNYSSDGSVPRLLIRAYNQNEEIITSAVTGWRYNSYYQAYYIDSNNGSFALPSASYIQVGLVFTGTTNEQGVYSQVMLVEGTTAAEYVEHESQTYPLTLGTMELCKIGDYQDYIYYSNDNWYKKEYIGKTTDVSGSTSITINDMVNDSGFYSYYGGTLNGKTITYASAIPGTNTILYQKSQYTDIPITDTTLINQLNDIALLNGTNNIVITGDDLPPIMNLHYNFKEAYTEENLLFCGVVKNSGNISLNPRYPHFSSLQIIDFKTFLSEGETLDFVISNKTVSEAIDQVINAISDYGFVLGNIQIFGADDVIGAYNCENKTAYDVFQYLSEITGSRWFTRMIDQNTVAIDFYDPTLMESGQNIEYTTEWFENNNVEDLSYNYGTYDYRNKQIMESDKVFASIDYTENIVADGYAKIFQTSTSIGVVKSITAGGVSKTFATNSDKELGVEADFYYTPNEVNLETDATYSAGTVITIVYTPLVKGRRVIRNYDEITRIAGQTNRRGTIARYETRNDVTDGSELEKIGETYLKYKGSPEINLKLVVRDNDIYSIGQVAYFDAPLEDLQTEYLLKKKTTNIITDNNQFIYQYVYEFTSSFNVENEVNYFDNQRNKAKGNIAEGEYIIRDVDIDEQANIIFHNLTISEVTVSDDNILEAVLESPLTK